MARLGLERDPARDFIAHSDLMGDWQGLAWVGRGADVSAGARRRAFPAHTLSQRQTEGLRLIPEHF